MGPTWVLSVPDGPHVGPMNLAIRVYYQIFSLYKFNFLNPIDAKHGNKKSIQFNIESTYNLTTESTQVDVWNDTQVSPGRWPAY